MTTGQPPTDQAGRACRSLGCTTLPPKPKSVTGISVLCLAAFVASLIFHQLPASAGINVDDMEPPYNANGRPVSSITLNGHC